MAAKGSAPSLEGRGRSAVPVGWEREGAALPAVSAEEAGREATCGSHPVDGKEPRGTSTEDVCMDGQSGFCPRPPRGGIFFFPWGYN